MSTQISFTYTHTEEKKNIAIKHFFGSTSFYNKTHTHTHTHKKKKKKKKHTEKRGRKTIKIIVSPFNMIFSDPTNHFF